MSNKYTCEGCRYYLCTDDPSYTARVYCHYCYVEPQPILRAKGQSHQAPIACARREEKEQ